MKEQRAVAIRVIFKLFVEGASIKAAAAIALTADTVDVAVAPQTSAHKIKLLPNILVNSE